MTNKYTTQLCGQEHRVNIDILVNRRFLDLYTYKHTI